jgi:hypothetical protein
VSSKRSPARPISTRCFACQNHISHLYLIGLTKWVQSEAATIISTLTYHGWDCWVDMKTLFHWVPVP